MNNDADVTYFEDWDTEDIFACIGIHGHEGIFRLRDPKSGNRDWEFQIPTSPAYGSIHQCIFRNFRAEKISSSDVISQLPPLPDVPKGPFPSFEDFYLPKEKIWASDYPTVARLVGEQYGNILKICIVLMEDKYESSHGDGVFYYFKDVFLNDQDGIQFVKVKNNENYSYHLRDMTIKIERRVYEFPGFKLQLFDHYGPVEVLKSLEEKLK